MKGNSTDPKSPIYLEGEKSEISFRELLAIEIARAVASNPNRGSSSSDAHYVIYMTNEIAAGLKPDHYGKKWKR